jgi:glyoxylase-like metal-dependent hydrolase (beta-lactamase superfamily II)/rhodanese-related sulfurtransferase
MKLRQIRSVDGTGTLTYIVADTQGQVAAVIDPNVEDIARIVSAVDVMGVRVAHILDTHTHADHISAAGELKAKYGADIIMHENTKNKWRIVDQGDRFGIGDILRANAGIQVDRYIADGEVIELGSIGMKALFTPGHTDNHICLLLDDTVFTGDLLLVGQAGRSDLPGGNAEQQYESLFTRILPLSDRTRMYPGHDYAGNEFAYLGEEKKTNPFLRLRTKAEYVAFVQEFFPPLAEAASTHAGLTLQCGTARVPQKGDTYWTITVHELSEALQSARRPKLLDVREPVELINTGVIEGVRNIPVRELQRRLHELPRDKSTAIVCICSSGRRSAEAAHLLQTHDYTNVANLVGGILEWMRRGYRVVRYPDTGPTQPAGHKNL